MAGPGEENAIYGGRRWARAPYHLSDFGASRHPLRPIRQGSELAKPRYETE